MFRRILCPATRFVACACVSWRRALSLTRSKQAQSTRFVFTGDSPIRPDQDPELQDAASMVEPLPLPEGVIDLLPEDASYVNVELRSLLVGKGEIPIGSVPKHLSERSRDLLAMIGGLGTFTDTYGRKMFAKLTHSSGTVVIMSRHYAPHSFVKKTVDLLIGQGGDAIGGSGIPVSGLYTRLPISMRMYMNLRAQRLGVCLRSHPEVFAVSEDRRLIGLASSTPRFPVTSFKALQDNIDDILSSGTHAIQAAGYNERMRHGLMTTTGAQGTSFEARNDVSSAMHGMLLSALPMSCFVPLTQVAKRLSPQSLGALCGSTFNADDPVASLKEKFSSLPSGVVDIRVIGDPQSEAKVFIRFVADRMTGLSSDGEDAGEERFANYNVNHLGHDIAEAFRAAGCEETTVNALPSVLPKELLDQFPLQGPPAILVFDRMQHLFDVDKVNFAVRLRREGEPFSASMYTTPAPRAVRYFSFGFHKPVQIDALAEHMPSFVTSEIFATFGSIKRFIAAHRMYVFVQEGGLVYTPAIMASEQGSHGVTPATKASRSVPEYLKSPESAAKHIHSLLPPNRFVDFLKWMKRQEFPQALVKIVNSPEPALFVHRFPELFNSCYPKFSSSMLLGRSDVPFPKAIWSPCQGIEDALKQIASSSLGGKQESDIFNEISREARLVTKAFGGIEILCKQIPQWFEVNNRAGIPGQSFITYFGHLQGKENKKQAVDEAVRKATESGVADIDPSLPKPIQGGNRRPTHVTVLKRPS